MIQLSFYPERVRVVGRRRLATPTSIRFRREVLTGTVLRRFRRPALALVQFDGRPGLVGSSRGCLCLVPFAALEWVAADG